MQHYSKEKLNYITQAQKKQELHTLHEGRTAQSSHSAEVLSVSSLTL
jgi:hypothetical protein